MIGNGPGSAIVATYVYRKASGDVAHEVLRKADKQFLQRHYEDGAPVWGLNGTEPLPYRLPELLHAADLGGTCFVVEGEKDADRLAADLRLGEGGPSDVAVTTSAGGAAWNWPAEWAERFRGFERVYVIADNDAPGRRAAQQRAAVIASAVKDVRIQMALPGVADKGDVSDYLDAGHTINDLWKLLDGAPRWEPDRSTEDQTADESSLQATILRSKLLTVEQVKAMPPPEPLIAGVLNRRKLSIVWGKPGSAKSFVALDWGLSVGTGSWWFGRQVAQGLVIYLAAEGADGLGVRIDAWQKDRRVHSVTAEQFLLLPNAVNLLDREWANALVEVAGDLKPTLVIADTLARSMPGGDENGSRDTGIVIDTANRVQAAAGATVLFVHHDTREGSNLRGHSSLDGAMDSSIECKADGQNITLKSRKQKDMSDFDDLRLWREPVGESCVIWSRDRVGVTAVGATDGERALLDVARECCGSDGLAPSKLQDVAEMPNSSFYRNLKNLLGRGALINVGTENRPRYTVPTDAET